MIKIYEKFMKNKKRMIKAHTVMLLIMDSLKLRFLHVFIDYLHMLALAIPLFNLI